MLEYDDGQTPLDQNELDGFLFKGLVTTQGELNKLEQSNIKNGMIWLQRKKNLEVLSEQIIRDLHYQLFGNVWSWAGKFRLTEKNIGVDPFKIPIEIKNLLDDARYWVAHKTFAPYEIALRFHHRLVLIHPFSNGNGRHARILADALLQKTFMLPGINWPQRDAYIAALRAADTGNLGLLLAFNS